MDWVNWKDMAFLLFIMNVLMGMSLVMMSCLYVQVHRDCLGPLLKKAADDLLKEGIEK